jgi:hypothetical protein
LAEKSSAPFQKRENGAESKGLVDDIWEKWSNSPNDRSPPDVGESFISLTAAMFAEWRAIFASDKEKILHWRMLGIS